LLLKNLTPASGRQDHTTSPSAGNIIRLVTLPHPSYPAPNVRDDRETPLVGRDGGVLNVILVNRKPEYFVRLGWTAQIRLNPFDIIAPWRPNFPQPIEVPDHGPKHAFAESCAKAKKQLPPVR
jgi:hypothetical protein